ncbi:hypothetical protein ACQEU3_10925 [Spirillospora sp. CA-253888]
MRTPSRIALSLLGSTALLVAGATAAHASGYVYVYDETTLAVYSGGVQGTGLGTGTLSTPSPFSLVHSCGSAQFSAAASGTGAWGFGSFTMNCTNNKAGTTTLTSSLIRTTGAQYSPVAGGRNGYLATPLFDRDTAVQVVMTLPALGIPAVRCTYGLTSSNPVRFDWFDRANPNRPVPANAHAQLALTGQSFQRLYGDTWCSASLGITATFQVLAQPSGHDLRLIP